MSKLRYIVLALAAIVVFSALASANPSYDEIADNKIRAEIDFLTNKLYKVNRYVDTLENKLSIAEKRKNGLRITRLNNLLTKGYKRMTRVKKLILGKHEELAALYEKAENKPNYTTIYSDPVYNAEPEQAVEPTSDSYEDSIRAYERDILDVKPPKKEPVRPKETKKDKGLLSDINTSYNVSADTQAPENGEINNAQVAASFNANKGPVYFQYTHSRNYSRMVDYYGDVMSEFDGMVNNRVEVGVSFSTDPEPTEPEFVNTASEPNVNTAPVSNNVSSGVSASSVPY